MPIRQRTSAGPKRSALVPSVVAVRADGTTAVGEEARDVVRERGRPPREGMDTFTATKNDIGTRKQYPKAPEHLNNPAKVAEHILRFLVAGAQEAYPGRFDRVVVTVPASFQLTQREDTAKAALESGIGLKAYDLMDEPVAAFLTFAAQRAEGVAAGRYMVLDVGGGTSDVALLSVEPTHRQVQVNVSGTSRYCRLGGSDIDRAIVVEHLLPALGELNGCDPKEWTYTQLASVIIPGLLDTAEELKTKLSRRMAARRTVGSDWSDLEERTSRDVHLEIPKGAALTLPAGSVSMNAEEFACVMAAYLDPDESLPRNGEYYESASIFAPLRELLDRRGWDAQETTLLLAGGTSHTTLLQDALADHLGVIPLAIHGSDHPLAQTEISQGAALQSFSLALDETSPLVVPRSDEALVIETATDPREVIPQGTVVPWPDDPRGRVIPLRLSDGSKSNGLRLSFTRNGVTVQNQVIEVPVDAQDGDSFTLRARMDANQQVALECEFACGARHTFQIDRPWSYVVNPQVARDRILELEADHGDPSATPREKLEIREQLVDLYRAVGHLQKAADSARFVLQRAESDEDYATASNDLANVLWEQGAREEALHALRRAAPRAEAWLLWNLAWRLEQCGRLEEALDAVDTAMAADPDGSSQSLRGRILKGLGRATEAESQFRSALSEFGHPRTASDFDLHWMDYVARQVGDESLRDSIKDSRRRVAQASTTKGVLPEADLPL
ncbi:tetratricopeptide repeat protein [Terracoccus luteus]|uniref:Tetratricopeptide repeat protein n=1 Tax=Terracoccus luteus TaxID=53356 RepID=A0A495XXU1_9MICO|nr:tetratricopeptide repeat protein [Terracoccus luteus]